MPHYLMPDGEKLYVREFGQGTPVLVLSGLGMQIYGNGCLFYINTVKSIRFYIPDWRGFGGSAQCKIPTLNGNFQPLARFKLLSKSIDFVINQKTYNLFDLKLISKII